MPSMSAVVTLMQDDAQTSSNSVSLNGETTVNVDLSAMSPGPFMVRISATGTGMADFGHTFDLGTSKQSAAPSLTVAMGEWIGENYELTGQFNDPDGDPVTITATDNGNMGHHSSQWQPMDGDWTRHPWCRSEFNHPHRM